MDSRVRRIAGLEYTRGFIHIFVALIDGIGRPLEELDDVLNEEGGAERLDRAYSHLRMFPKDTPERQQALESILDDNGEETDDDEEEEDDDEDDADDEQEGNNVQEALVPVLVVDPSPQVEEEAAAVEEDADLEPAAVEAGADLEPAAAEEGAGLEPAAAEEGAGLGPAAAEEGAGLEPASGSQDSVLDYERNSGDDTEWDDNDLLDCGKETDTPGGEDEWSVEEDEQEETDKEESGELSATDADTQATLEADASDQEGAGSSGGWEYSARQGGEASGAAVGHKRGADAAYYTPLLPKRPRHETSTSSTISTASTVNQEAAVAEEASMMLVEPPQDGLNNAGGNALVVYLGAPAPMAATAMVPIAAGGSTAEATGEGSPLIALQRQVSDLQQWQLQTMLDRRMEQQQMTQIQRALRTLWYPEELVAECNKAVVAIGATNVRQGTGSFLAQGLIATAHHVLLDCGWNAATPSLVQVGMGENIVWSHQAEVLAWAPTPRPPATGMPDHHFNKPKPWLDLALLKIVRSPSSIAGLGACLRASRFPIKQGVPIAVLGYGQQTSSDAQTVMFGEVACCARRDDRIGCAVFDIGGAGMLSGHSGGPVIDRRDGGVHGYCISSQSEASLGSCGITINTPFGRRTIKGKAKIQNAVGGLHTVIPISELAFLLGTSLTA
mgnify:CR=1 FL=1